MKVRLLNYRSNLEGVGNKLPCTLGLNSPFFLSSIGYCTEALFVNKVYVYNGSGEDKRSWVGPNPWTAPRTGNSDSYHVMREGILFGENLITGLRRIVSQDGRPLSTELSNFPIRPECGWMTMHVTHASGGAISSRKDTINNGP